MTSLPTDQLQRGFTLAELAVVLVIVGILLGGLIMPLSAQLDSRNISDTNKTLTDARDALLGFAAANGRLPCPALSTTSGLESPVGGGSCTGSTVSNPVTGFVPAATLGLTPTDSQGFLVDAWGNRIRYAVTAYSTHLYTTANALKSNWPNRPTDPPTLLTLASTAASGGTLTDNAVAVIFSVGRNKSATTGIDESHNLNNDRFFISHEPTAANSTGGEFDDIVTWIAEPILFNRLIAAGRLP